MTILSTPETELSFGAQSLIVLDTKPAGLATGAVTAAEATAGVNISLHVVGSWFPTASTDNAATQRKMGAKKTASILGVSTYTLPDLTYTHLSQKADTEPGNEARAACVPGAIKYLLLRNGVPGDTPVAADDRGKIIPVQFGPQVESQSADDAGGEETITQSVGFAPGYDEPVSVTVS